MIKRRLIPLLHSIERKYEKQTKKKFNVINRYEQRMLFKKDMEYI